MILVRDPELGHSLEPVPDFALPLYGCWDRLVLDLPEAFDLRIILQGERESAPLSRWRSGRILAPQLGVALDERTIACLLGRPGDPRESTARTFERVLTTIVERLRAQFGMTIWLDRVCGRQSFERLVTTESCPETKRSLDHRRHRRLSPRECGNVIEEVRPHHLHDKWLTLADGHDLCRTLASLCVAEELFSPIYSHVYLQIGTDLCRALRTGAPSEEWFDWGCGALRRSRVEGGSEEERQGEVRDAIFRAFTDIAEVDRWDPERTTAVLRRACEEFGVEFEEAGC